MLLLLVIICIFNTVLCHIYAIIFESYFQGIIDSLLVLAFFIFAKSFVGVLLYHLHKCVNGKVIWGINLSNLSIVNKMHGFSVPSFYSLIIVSLAHFTKKNKQKGHFERDNKKCLQLKKL